MLPLARRVTRQLRTPQWSYVGSTWPENDPRTGGWHHPSVVDAQRGRWADFLAAVRGTGPLGLNHEAARVESDCPSAHNAIMSFAYVMARAAGARTAVSVLDWGGGLGYYGVIGRTMLPAIAFDYTVKDIAAVCVAGRALNPEVTFVDSAEVAFGRRYDVVFVSNALQYEPDWRTLLARLADAAERWVFLTRVPFVERAASFVVTQRPRHVGYQTEYLGWVFNRHELLDQAASLGLTLEREFLMVDERNEGVAGAPEPHDNRGFLFRTTP